MKRLFYICAGVMLFASAMALTTFEKTFEKTYEIKKDSNLDKIKCAVCHVKPKGGKLNPYGEDMAAAMKEAKTKKLTEEILRAVEKLDSDKDGKSNLDEIKADSNPGAK
jgi:hypothetical protein